MAYALETDLDTSWTAAQIDLLTVDPVTLARNEQAIAQALDDASARIDGYLSSRYVLPLSLTPGGVSVLRGICCDLAVGFLASGPERMTEVIKARMEAAIVFLRDVAANRASIPQLPAINQDASAPVSPNEVLFSASDRVMTRESLEGY